MDIVKWLKEKSHDLSFQWQDRRKLEEAADEIEKLRTHNDMLREALKYYADPKTYYDVGHIVGWDYGSIARSALKQKESE